MSRRQHDDHTRWMALTLAAVLLATGPAGASAQEQEELAGSTFTEGGEGGAVLPEMVVEAQNKVRQSIEKTDFEMELSAAVIDSFLSGMDEEALGISPVSGLQPHFNNLERLASDQTPHEWLREMAREPVATFYPQETEGHKPREWALTITDFRGSPFRSFQGSGRPPDRLGWDGRGDNGAILRMGYPYSYVFQVTDRGTNTYNHAGVGFRIPALDYREKSDRILAFAGDQLFPPQGERLLPGGQGWLTRACDLIRRHPYSPVRVRVVAEDAELAERRADAVAAYLAASMILPREQVETAFEQRPDLRAEMDGSVEITIEHAD